MRTRSFVAILAVILSDVFAGPASAAPPDDQTVLQKPASVMTKPIQPAPGTISSRPEVKIKEKQAATLTVIGASGAPGEKKVLEAVFKSGGAPLAGKMVSFRIESKGKSKVPGGSLQMGSGTTNAAGRIIVPIVAPELARGSYTLTAAFSGDESTLDANAQAGFVMKKAGTRIDLTSRLQVGAPAMPIYVYDAASDYSSVAASGHAILKVALERISDEKSLDRRVTVTTEGYAYVPDAKGHVTQAMYKSGPILTHQSSREFMSNSELILEPLDGVKWKVDVRYDGDDSSLPSTATLSYERPKEPWN